MMEQELEYLSLTVFVPQPEQACGLHGNALWLSFITVTGA